MRPSLNILQTRDKLLRTIRAFFQQHGFIEVQTPTVVPSPGLDPHLLAYAVHDDRGKQVGWLNTSPEYQMKRLLCEGATKIFQICPAYRVDERGKHHEREFTMLEWYRANASSQDIVEDSIALIRSCADALEAPAELDLASSWNQQTVRELFARFAPEFTFDTVVRDEETFFRLWVERIEPELSTDRPTIVIDWPASMASLAQIKANGNADRFEIFIAGIELCNGFGELTDAAEQRKRFKIHQSIRKHRGCPIYPIDERFLSALQSGMPDSGGNALGVDRLLMVLTQAQSIQQGMSFPVERL